MLHFVILGVKSVNTVSGAKNFQSIEDVIRQKFISFENDEVVNLDSPINETDVTILDSVDFFVRSKTYDRLWNQC